MTENRNIRLEPATGGYVVTFTVYRENKKDAYDGMSFHGDETEIFEDGAEALKRIDELAKDSTKLKKISVKTKA